MITRMMARGRGDVGRCSGNVGAIHLRLPQLLQPPKQGGDVTAFDHRRQMALGKALLPHMDGDQLPKNLEVGCVKKLGLPDVALRLLLPRRPIKRKHEAIGVHGADELVQLLRENVIRDPTGRRFDSRWHKVLPLEYRKEDQDGIDLLTRRNVVRILDHATLACLGGERPKSPAAIEHSGIAVWCSALLGTLFEIILQLLSHRTIQRNHISSSARTAYFGTSCKTPYAINDSRNDDGHPQNNLYQNAPFFCLCLTMCIRHRTSRQFPISGSITCHPRRNSFYAKPPAAGGLAPTGPLVRAWYADPYKPPVSARRPGSPLTSPSTPAPARANSARTVAPLSPSAPWFRGRCPRGPGGPPPPGRLR